MLPKLRQMYAQSDPVPDAASSLPPPTSIPCAMQSNPAYPVLHVGMPSSQVDSPLQFARQTVREIYFEVNMN